MPDRSDRYPIVIVDGYHRPIVRLPVFELIDRDERIGQARDQNTRTQPRRITEMDGI